MNTCTIITGCPRSGTSIVAAVCQELGLYIGNQFEDADEYNPTGYWEDLEWIGASLRFCDVDKNRPHVPVYVTNDDPHAHDNIRYRIMDRLYFANGRPWGFKLNNLMETFLPAFIAQASTFKIVTNAIIMHRDGNAIRKSWDKYLKAKTPKWKLTTQHIDEMAVRRTQTLDCVPGIIEQAGGRVMQFNFEDLVATPQVVVQQLADFIDLPYSDTAAALVTPDLVHF